VNVRSKYCIHPGKQLGADLLRILPEGYGGVLLVVVDVNGKGLKAAMTVIHRANQRRFWPTSAAWPWTSEWIRHLLRDVHRGGHPR
jgi:hypothetical protein